jgi:molybdopterin molybdotransferase
MINVQQAIEIINKQIQLMPEQIVELPQAFNRVLTQSVYAQTDTPPFDNSAMDGYAFRFEDLKQSKTFKIVGTVAAGNIFDGVLQKNEAVRIYTGACMPLDADTVVMQEKTTAFADTILINDAEIIVNNHVRPKGSQNKTGQMLVRHGNTVTEMVIGYLASAGVNKVSVYQPPKIAIITTGTELVKPGNPLTPGKIFESNSWMLNAAVNKLFLQAQLYACNDDLQQLSNLLLQVSEHTDLILLTGGVSVGDYDYVVPALQKTSAQIYFHKIKQKPGKPLLFGKLNNTFIFGLPGNPASSLSCFYNYVKPALMLMQGKAWPTYQSAMLQNEYQKKAGLTHFVKSVMHNGGVTILKGQESYLLHSFAAANCMAVLPETATHFEPGMTLDILPI